MPDALKICPRCRAEYLAHVDTCADCRVPLVWKHEGVPLPDTLEGAPDLVPIRTEEPTWIHAFADTLRREGIPSLIRVASTPDRTAARGSFGQGWRYTLYVRKPDEAHARALDEACWLASGEADVSAPDLGDIDSQRCPACGARVDPTADECPSCGLYLAAS